MLKMCMIRLQVTEGTNARDQIGFCTFHSFLVGVQMNAAFNIILQPGDKDC